MAEPTLDAERVLVVDDDPPLQRMLTRTLSAEGFAVTVAGDGGAALAAAERVAPDVIVLDVAMPTLDGLAVCRRLRDKGLPTPILMLTARDAVQDRVAGLQAGADDYLVKPFAVEELVARLRALTRRGQAPTGCWPTPISDARHRHLARPRGGPRWSSHRPRVGAAGGQAAGARAGRIVTREHALEEIWDDAAEANVVDRNVTRLRRKLGDPPLIRTLRGTGFVLRA